MVQKAKGKVLMLPKQVNHATGKVSNQSMGFNEVMWGKHCKSYMKLTKKLSGTQFNKVVRLATKFMKVNHCLVDEDDDIIEIKDICANVIDISSSSEDDAECK
jgi:hypothetical protein